ncbi:unnamed protein product [Orchesella dallaii]|uniref:Uncharacterized protein n=1 Tax=Orchesella dallaii TaxID=48710 RepID=A0ABP1S1Y3_9HEXA
MLSTCSQIEVVCIEHIDVLDPQQLNNLAEITRETNIMFRGKATECSAKENRNVREIFRGFLTLSKIPFRNAEDSGGILKTGPSISLRRRSSAYAGSKNRNMGTFKGEDQQQQQSQPSPATEVTLDF